MILDIKAIKELIPHRSPFLFIDKCEIKIPGEHGIAIKKFSEDEYFFIGDNRDNSFDSRSFGPITSSRMIGKAFFKIYPLDQIQNLND